MVLCTKKLPNKILRLLSVSKNLSCCTKKNYYSFWISDKKEVAKWQEK